MNDEINEEINLDQETLDLEEKNKRNRAILEGLLFIVGEDGITINKASEVLDLPRRKIQSLFKEIEMIYNDESHGIQLTNYGEVYRFLTKEFVANDAKKLFQMKKKNTLSPAMLETLAIIAYKQPITRVEIEEIRGVGADAMLRKLIARDMIQEQGRSDAPGRPILYGVTEEFMNAFKLVSLDELPELPNFATNEESEDLFE